MKKLREFPEWRVEQVMEVAKMLYALQRNLLARQAFDFLDKLGNACNTYNTGSSVFRTPYGSQHSRLDGLHQERCSHMLSVWFPAKSYLNSTLQKLTGW